MIISSKTWEEIEAAPKLLSGWIVRRLYPESSLEILAGRRARDDARALLIEIGTRSMPSGAHLPDCLGFQVSLETIKPGPGGTCRVCLLLKENRYIEIFTALCNDIVDQMLATAYEPSAIKLLLARLNTWQRFLEKFGLNPLSREEQAGLLGELLILETELVPRIGARSSIQAWRGPYGEPHDFRHADLALEVKSATVRHPTSFQVSNLEQLDLGSAHRLFVVHLLLLNDPDDGTTLPDVVARVRKLLDLNDPGAASEFDACLIEGGYLEIHAEGYRERRLTEHERRWFEVEPRFPRLTPSLIADGILAARYTVSLARISEFEVPADLPRSLLK